MLFLDKAVAILQNGGIILVPTDTHFALAASPYCPEAVEKMVMLKSSLSVNEMTLCFCEMAEIWPWVEVSPWQKRKIEALSRAYWPGALKISLKKKKQSMFLPCEGDIVSVVCVKNRQIRSIISLLKGPLVVIPAGCQQNTSHLVSFTRAREYMGDMVDLVVPSNSKVSNKEATTHISLLDDKLSIIRHGEIEISEDL
ncbi:MULTISPECIES: L-threonylcarbamoyladenylate synthase [Tenebrionibacter/Tenebrionicola group]|jgi:L-threonylcarbamoyladenylate synthase|uniref:L-threonylcarbamoyladenylate synthase n=2 Tax=Tenebrionibacter/Tenebrionicola group TaxID=2969848 RepID=A0A8K0XYR2_9ENTR|nr:MULTISPECIES: Sua5/YciO/YrdC/YwlC family protein [Tenebrionibacter/Tenebrionicola group]MBK4716657.1 Sua5/YciO/YrdC/YwlC family protein [Tenebrionibacter intestinalis]MBV5097331.1 Sua5/YciO/YrdC/YwlC family protein [Tenebrionicola larvae]